MGAYNEMPITAPAPEFWITRSFQVVLKATSLQKWDSTFTGFLMPTGFYDRIATLSA